MFVFRNIVGAVVAMAFSGIALAQQTEPSDQEAVEREDAYFDQIGRGAEAWVDTCGRCHNLRAPGELPPELWDVSVTHMRVRANLPGDMAEDIKAFLMMSSESMTEEPASGVDE